MTARNLAVGLFGALVFGVAAWFWLFASEEKTPLFESILTSDLATIESYLGEGGDPNALAEVRSRGVYFQLLKIALYDRKEEVALLLLDHGADFETGDMAPYEVAREGMPRFLDRLLSQGVIDFDIQAMGYALSSAANSGYYDVVQVIFRYADATSLGSEWDAKLNLAAEGSMGASDDVARLLLDAATELSKSSLHSAARFSSPGMIRYLLARGADPNEELPEADVILGSTPIDYAMYRLNEMQLWLADGNEAPSQDVWLVIHELLQAGAEADLPEETVNHMQRLVAEFDSIEEPQQKLVAASRFGYYDIVQDLLDNQGENFSEEVLRESLIAAYRTKHDDIARLLIERDAPVLGGALHTAAMYSSPGMVRYLFQQGADPLERVSGQTPAEAWKQNSHTANADRILHELILGGAEVCWLVEHVDELPGFSSIFLRDTAPHCWK